MRLSSSVLLCILTHSEGIVCVFVCVCVCSVAVRIPWLWCHILRIVPVALSAAADRSAIIVSLDGKPDDNITRLEGSIRLAPTSCRVALLHGWWVAIRYKDCKIPFNSCVKGYDAAY